MASATGDVRCQSAPRLLLIWEPENVQCQSARIGFDISYSIKLTNCQWQVHMVTYGVNQLLSDTNTLNAINRRLLLIGESENVQCQLARIGFDISYSIKLTNCQWQVPMVTYGVNQLRSDTDNLNSINRRLLLIGEIGFDISYSIKLTNFQWQVLLVTYGVNQLRSDTDTLNSINRRLLLIGESENLQCHLARIGFDISYSIKLTNFQWQVLLVTYGVNQLRSDTDTLNSINRRLLLLGESENLQCQLARIGFDISYSIKLTNFQWQVLLVTYGVNQLRSDTDTLNSINRRLLLIGESENLQCHLARIGFDISYSIKLTNFQWQVLLVTYGVNQLRSDTDTLNSINRRLLLIGESENLQCQLARIGFDISYSIKLTNFQCQVPLVTYGVNQLRSDTNTLHSINLSFRSAWK
ncbi:hypothetical protein J6590_099983 [Homalodisca vitripennis]|nr:hypothetical protein J6590_099983 [Homalodisca vitripennis]